MLSGDLQVPSIKDDRGQHGLKKIKKNFQVAIPKSLYLFTSAVLMCEKYVVHNTVAGCGMSVYSISVCSLWVTATFMCKKKNRML